MTLKFEFTKVHLGQLADVETERLKIADAEVEGLHLLPALRCLPTLKQLMLDACGATIACLQDCDFSSLQSLSLSANKLRGLDGLSKVALPRLKYLSLSNVMTDNNELEDIRELGLCRFQGLLRFSAYGNKITEIQSLFKSGCMLLQKLWLHKNKIRSVAVLRGVKLSRLKQLTIYENELEDWPLILECEMPQVKSLLAGPAMTEDLAKACRQQFKLLFKW